MADRVLRDPKGLYAKFAVTKGGHRVTGFFVLRPERDAAALSALIRYADVTTNRELAADLNEWIGEIQHG